MGAALSVDLRTRVVAACRDEGATYEEAARRFGVGYASVSRWLRLYRQTNQLEARPLPGRTPRIDEAGRLFVRQFVESRPDASFTSTARSGLWESASRAAHRDKDVHAAIWTRLARRGARIAGEGGADGSDDRAGDLSPARKHKRIHG